MKLNIKRQLAATFCALQLLTLLSTSVANADDTSAKRIVAIGGAVTEIIYALGEQDRQIGRDTTSVFPPEALALPDVGYIRRLSPEGVLSVDPDLILALEGSGPAEALDALLQADVPVTMIPEGFTAEKVEEKILAVARALKVEDKGKILAADTRAKIENAAKVTSTSYKTQKGTVCSVTTKWENHFRWQKYIR